jgi:predicted type IV restriction endonuclease
VLDTALQKLDILIQNLDTYIKDHYSEADTRVKFIDPLLTDVLGWNEYLHIRREENYKEDEERRCIDYLVSLQEPVLVVEAKKNLKEFEIPTTVERVRYSLDGVIKDWKNAWSAIRQVQGYCVHTGARYALVTNGHQYIAFKAISERTSWLKGHALVLRSPEILRKNFTLFYECLSKEAIAQDKLTDFAFPTESPTLRKKPRALIKVTNTGYRNELYCVLDSAFRQILLDVPSNDPNFLRECYCSSEDAMRYKGQLSSVLVDRLPIFRSPVEEVRPGDRRDSFALAIGREDIAATGTPLFVVMGGTGVGKTSFLHWYFDQAIPQDVKDNSVIIFCDYRTIECNTEELHSLTLKLVIDQIISQTAEYTTKFNQLYEMFRKKIDRELEGALKPFAKDSDERQKRIGELLMKFQDYSPQHLLAIASYLDNKRKNQVVVVLDNMDQKSPELQDKLYQVGNEFVYGCNLVVVLSLREATYRRMTNSPNFNAFASREFHVKAQPIDMILEKRLAFLRDRLSTEKVTVQTPTGTIDVLDFHRFIALIRRSLLSEQADPHIIECITAISNGNIREQLEMIYSFLVSGQTKIDEYFWTYARDEEKNIPFHEVLHSLLHEDTKFFDEGLGHRFINIFEPAATANSSHFTALRILSYLELVLGQTGELRQTDFVTDADIFTEFGDYGWSKNEISFHTHRLATFGLLMPESGDIKDSVTQQPWALTKSGIYYATTLYQEFTYFSAMASDTSIGDLDLANEIAQILRDNIQSAKVPLNVRRRMAEKFIGYLDSKEQSEVKGAISKHPVLGKVRFVPRMIQALRKVPR